MKKIVFAVLSVFLMHTALFSQSNDKMDVNVNNNGINIQFKNKKTKGYYNMTQIQLLMGNIQVPTSMYYYCYPLYSDYASDYAQPDYAPPYNSVIRTELQISPSISMINGYQFNEHWAAGIGVGFEIFDRNMFPVFADIRYVLWDNKVSPYFAMKAGYAFSDFKTKHYDNLNLNYTPYSVSNANFRCFGGLMLNPEAGIKVPLTENADLLFTVAYRYQKIRSLIRQDYDNNQFSEWENKESLNRLAFGVAIMFR